MEIFRQLRERKVLTTAAIYVPVAWLGIEVLTFLLEKFQAPGWLDELVAAAFVMGFPVTMLLSWTFDLVPGGVARTPVSGKQSVVTVALSLGLMIAGTAGLFQLIYPGDDNALVTPSPGQRSDRSIAVFPFDNLTADPDNDYFSLGVTVEIIGKLSRVEGLQVAAIAQPRQELERLGHALAVHYLLEGSVRRSGDQVRISVLLSDADTGFSMWSEDFNDELEDLFGMQERVAQQIAEALNLKLVAGKPDKGQVAAHERFVQGWALMESLHVNAESPKIKLEAARTNFRSALDIEPRSPRALAGMALVDAYSVYWGLRSENDLGEAQKNASDAINLGPNVAEGHFAMATVLVRQEDYAGAIPEYRRALNLDPQNGYAWCEFSYVLNTQDEPDPVAAEAAARKAIQFRPAYAASYANLGEALIGQGRRGEAIGAYLQASLLNPDANYIRVKLAELHLEEGDYDQALSYFTGARLSPKGQVSMAAAYLGIGESDKALRSLEEAFENGFDEIDTLAKESRFRSLAQDPRFAKLIAQYRQP